MEIGCRFIRQNAAKETGLGALGAKAEGPGSGRARRLPRSGAWWKGSVQCIASPHAMRIAANIGREDLFGAPSVADCELLKPSAAQRVGYSHRDREAAAIRPALCQG